MMSKLTENEPLDAVVEKESLETFFLTNRRHTLSANGLKTLREASLEQITLLDKNVEKSLSLFFSNRVREAENLLERNVSVDPFCALGALCISSTKAMLSLEHGDIVVALEKIAFAITFAEELVSPAGGLLSRVGSMFRGLSSAHKLLPGEFRSKTILAVAYTFRGLLLVLQKESINNMVKGGLALNKSYRLLKSLMEEMDGLKKKKQAISYDNLGLDRNSVYAVTLGYGCTNVILSLLPPRVLRVLDFLGFAHNRELGMSFVTMSLKSNTVLAPLALTFLMAINTLLSGFCPMLVPSSLSSAKDLAEAMEQPPINNSVMHLWLLGRMRRLELKMDESIRTFSKCMEVSDKGQISEYMPQLRDLAIYDQAWNYAAKLQWQDCISSYAHLEKNSTWSKMYYTYAQACCYEMLAHEAEGRNLPMALLYRKKATEAYWRTAHYGITMGRKIISIELLIVHRLNEIFSQSDVTHPNPGNRRSIPALTSLPPNGAVLRNTIVMPILELFVLFDLIHQLPHSLLNTFLQMIDQVLELNAPSSASATPSGADWNSSSRSSVGRPEPSTRHIDILMTLKTIVLMNMKERRGEGRNLLQKSLQTAHGYTGKTCTLSWMAPWLLYEEACQRFEDGDYETSEKILGQVEALNAKQIFRTVMETKVHFAKYALQGAKRKHG